MMETPTDSDIEVTENEGFQPVSELLTSLAHGDKWRSQIYDRARGFQVQI